jgi:hypothetical protein
MRTRKRHITEFIETLAGPAIFIVYFGLAYGAVGISQAKDARLLDADGMRLALTGLTVAALLALALVTMLAVRQRHNAPQGDEEDRFLARTTLWLNLLSAVAVAWTGVSAALFAF